MSFPGHVKSFALQLQDQAAVPSPECSSQSFNRLYEQGERIFEKANEVINRLKSRAASLKESSDAKEDPELTPKKDSEFRVVDDRGNQATRFLWVGNTPKGTTSSELRLEFGRFGPVESTRPGARYSFVNYSSVESAVKAFLQLHDKDLFRSGAPLCVRFTTAESDSKHRSDESARVKDNAASPHSPLQSRIVYHHNSDLPSRSHQSDPFYSQHGVEWPNGPPPTGPKSCSVNISPPPLRRESDRYRTWIAKPRTSEYRRSQTSGHGPAPCHSARQDLFPSKSPHRQQRSRSGSTSPSTKSPESLSPATIDGSKHLPIGLNLSDGIRNRNLTHQKPQYSGIGVTDCQIFSEALPRNGAFKQSTSCDAKSDVLELKQPGNRRDGDIDVGRRAEIENSHQAEAVCSPTLSTGGVMTLSREQDRSSKLLQHSILNMSPSVPALIDELQAPLLVQHQRHLAIPPSAVSRNKAVGIDYEDCSSTSEISVSTNSSSSRRKCRACGGPAKVTDALFDCSMCPRRYHLGCGVPKPASYEDKTAFKCQRCLAETTSREVQRSTILPTVLLSHSPQLASPPLSHGTDDYEHESETAAAGPTENSLRIVTNTDSIPSFFQSNTPKSPARMSLCSEVIGKPVRSPVYNQDGTFRKHPISRSDHGAYSSPPGASPTRVAQNGKLLCKNFTCCWWSSKHGCQVPEAECLFAHRDTSTLLSDGDQLENHTTCSAWLRGDNCPVREQQYLYAHRDTVRYSDINGRPRFKNITCFLWLSAQGCKLPESECCFAHEDTGVYVSDLSTPLESVSLKGSQRTVSYSVEDQACDEVDSRDKDLGLPCELDQLPKNKHEGPLSPANKHFPASELCATDFMRVALPNSSREGVEEDHEMISVQDMSTGCTISPTNTVSTNLAPVDHSKNVSPNSSYMDESGTDRSKCSKGLASVKDLNPAIAFNSGEHQNMTDSKKVSRCIDCHKIVFNDTICSKCKREQPSAKTEAIIKASGQTSPQRSSALMLKTKLGTSASNEDFSLSDLESPALQQTEQRITRLSSKRLAPGTSMFIKNKRIKVSAPISSGSIPMVHAPKVLHVPQSPTSGENVSQDTAVKSLEDLTRLERLKKVKCLEVQCPKQIQIPEQNDALKIDVEQNNPNTSSSEAFSGLEILSEPIAGQEQDGVAANNATGRSCSRKPYSAAESHCILKFSGRRRSPSVRETDSRKAPMAWAEEKPRQKNSSTTAQGHKSTKSEDPIANKALLLQTSPRRLRDRTKLRDRIALEVVASNESTEIQHSTSDGSQHATCDQVPSCTGCGGPHGPKLKERLPCNLADESRGTDYCFDSNITDGSLTDSVGAAVPEDDDSTSLTTTSIHYGSIAAFEVNGLKGSSEGQFLGLDPKSATLEVRHRIGDTRKRSLERTRLVDGAKPPHRVVQIPNPEPQFQPAPQSPESGMLMPSYKGLHWEIFDCDSSSDDNESVVLPSETDRLLPWAARPTQSRNPFDICPELAPNYDASQRRPIRDKPKISRKQEWANLRKRQLRDHREQFGNPHWEVNRRQGNAQVMSLVERRVRDNDHASNINSVERREKREEPMSFAEFLGIPKTAFACLTADGKSLAYKDAPTESDFNTLSSSLRALCRRGTDGDKFPVSDR